MAWPNPFRRTTSKTRTCWGYSFEFTDNHLTAEQAHPLKYTYDTLGEECLERLDLISPPLRSALPRNTPADVKIDGKREDAPPVPPRDLYILLRDNAHTDEKLKQLWTELNTIPDWVDWGQIERGQDVFYRYGGANVTGLAYQSLLGGMGAARVVETLARTGGFAPKVARRRLFETTQHILQCTRSIESIQPGGDGFASTIRVRLLHAAVRRRIMKLAAEKPEYYNVQEWGIPINDLDSMATISTFSATLIWLSLPRQGIWLREQEITDFVALWRYIAYLVGCPNEYFETPAKAKAIMETLFHDEIHPTDLSKLLANNIIRSLDDQPPSYASKDFLVANARWLNGPELSDRLGLPRPGLYYYTLVAGQCLFFMTFCYIYRSVPSWDRKKVSMLKKVFWTIIVESKYGLAGSETLFDFKYVPEFSTITDMDDGKDPRTIQRGVEWRNLKSFMIGVGVLGFVSYCGIRAVVGAVRWIWR